MDIIRHKELYRGKISEWPLEVYVFEYEDEDNHFENAVQFWINTDRGHFGHFIEKERLQTPKYIASILRYLSQSWNLGIDSQEIERVASLVYDALEHLE